MGATISFRSDWSPDGSKIAMAAGDRVFILDSNTLQSLNGPNGDINIGGQNHDAMFTPDGKYAILTLRTKPYTGDNASKLDGEIQLYNIATGSVVGGGVSVCNACHGQSAPKNSTLCGLDGKLEVVAAPAPGYGQPAGSDTYTGTLYIAGHGGHFAKTVVSIDPSNTANPITVTSLTTQGVSFQKFSGTGTAADNTSQYKLHDARLDGNTLYWSTYNTDANSLLHYGKIDLATGAVTDETIPVDARVTIPAIAPNMMPNYCASGQTDNYFMPITMAHEAYITVIPKSTIQ
jgi:WD40 repeat protein